MKQKKPSDHNTIKLTMEISGEGKMSKTKTLKKQEEERKPLRINSSTKWKTYRDELQRIELTEKVKRSNNDYNTFEKILWETAVKELSVRNESKKFKSKDKGVVNARKGKRRA